MRKFMLAVSTALAVGLVTPMTATASTPQEDVKAFQQYFYDKFPNVAKGDFKDGVYSLNEDFRLQWENTEEFPPYEDNIAKGEEMFNKPFANGTSYADCLLNGGTGTRQLYPYFDTSSGKLKTLEGEINACRKANGEKPLKWKKGCNG